MLFSRSDAVYYKFNSFIKEKYFSDEFKGESILFSFDSQSLFVFLNRSDLTEKQFKENIKETFRDSLSYYIKSTDLFFGVCALEILVVHQMKEGSKFTSRQYNPPLIEILGIKSTHLQTFYKKYQDELWTNLKRFCDKNGFYIYLPSSHDGPGRYIQYPFSQALLRQEDLNRCPYLFKELGLRKNTYMPFSEFNNLLDESFYYSCKKFLSSHFIHTKERLVKYHQTYKQLNLQIFDYYNLHWNGSYSEYNKKSRLSNVQPLYKELTNVCISRSLTEIFIREADSSEINIISISDDLFSVIEDKVGLFYHHLLFFEKDKILGEGTYIRKMEEGKDYILIAEKEIDIGDHMKSLSVGKSIPNSYYDIFIFENISFKDNDSFWIKYFSSRPRNYRISGGLKIGFRIWMEGAGPIINLPENVNTWFDGHKIEKLTFDCTDLPVGTYKLKVGKFPPETIIIGRETISDIEYQGGWKIDKEQWQPSLEDCQVEGMLFRFKNEETKTTTRSWINSLINKGDGANDSSQVVKSIYRSNYGI